MTYLSNLFNSTKLRLVAQIAMLCLFLSGCQSPEPTVSFAVFGDPAELAAYEALVDTFHAQHPNIDVRLEHTPGQGAYRQKLATTFSAGSPPDVMLLNYRRFATFAETGGLTPLGERVAASEQFSADDFFEIAIDSFEWNDQLWCVPQNLSSLVVYVNRDLFAEAGVAMPSNNWTWEQLLLAAQQLTQDKDGDGTPEQFGVGLSPKLFRLAPFVWQNGGEIVDNQAQPTRLT
ncbi:MAG: extracellular solute-binding protein, partial [Candidatus Promineifilaceae bacterium]